MSARRVYFHEDDFCQIELVPAENWEHCATEMGNCPFAGRIEPVELTLPPGPGKRRDPVVRPLKSQFL